MPSVIKYVGAEKLKSHKESNQTGSACISSVEISVIDSSGDKTEKNHLEFGKEKKPSKRMSVSKQSEGAERSSKQLFERGRRVRCSQITMVNMVVTTAFAISYFPKLALFILESTNFWSFIPTKVFVLCSLILPTY